MGRRQLRCALAVLGMALPGGPARGGEAACALWRGTVAERDVVVSLAVAADGAMTGRYAYLHVGKSIELRGRRHGTSVVLEEHAGRKGAASGTWRLDVQGDALAGSFQAPKSQRKTKIHLACLATSAGQVKDPFFAERLRGKSVDQQFELVAAEGEVPGKVTEAAGGTAFVTVKRARTGNTLDQILRHPLPRAMAEVNDAIRAKVAESENAEEDGRKEVPTCDFNITASISHLSPGYATLSADADFDCGGAHPSEERTVQVYELGAGGAKVLDFDKIYNLRSRDGFQRSFIALLDRALETQDRERLDDCPDAGNEGFSLQFGVGADAITVAGDYGSHALAACAFEVTFKPAQLRRYLRPGAPPAFTTGKF